MLKKIKSVYKEHGIFNFLKISFNFIFRKIFGFEIVISTRKRNPALTKCFEKCKIIKSSEGYFYLDPMPSINDLNDYYKSIYWQARNGRKFGANTRDFVHYHLLKDKIPNFFNTKKKVLNFGAGHGGMSNIFWFEGFDVINVEPSGLPNFFKNRWSTVSNIEDVTDNSIDFVYGSHSLEHVQDIHYFKKQISRIVKDENLIFWEVPNAKNQNNGPIKNKIRIPHTYYFLVEFFEKWFDKVLLNKAYKQSHDLGIIEDWESYEDPEGQIIRALGQINLKNKD